ncbi:MAG: hypothetical protein IJX19_10225 [Clostridia bacterium]|nr:hypothetical protein [Clostridia bacterium]
MKKVLCLILAMLLVLPVLAACDKEEAHTHTYAADWTYDEVNHWHKATCEHTDEKGGLGAHVDSDGDLMCDVCQRVEAHTHTYEETWSFNADSHWHKGSCGHPVTKDAAPHADADNNGICDVCAYDEQCAHDYKVEWSANDTKHWHDTACGHSMGKKDEADHVDANNDGACDVCEYKSCEHTYNKSWSSDKENHWKDPSCGHAVDPIEMGAHTGMDDNTCDVCGYVKAHEHTYETTYTITGETHYYAATCEHTGEKRFEAEHVDTTGDDKCDVCGYVMKQVLFESVLTGSSQFTDIEAWMNSDNILKFDLEPGKYVISSPTSTDIRFGEMGITSWGEPGFVGAVSYVFTMETAGEKEIIARYNTWEVTGTTLDYTYNLVKIDDLVLETMSGANRVLASNALYTVSITFPKAGVYLISSSVEGLAWNDALVDSFVVGVTEENLTATFTLLYASETEASFSFDWKVGTFEQVEIKDGENKINVPNSDAYLRLDYVVTAPGTYSITANSDFVSFYVWSDPYGYGYNMNYQTDVFSGMKAGDVITVYVKAYVYDENYDPVDVATIEDIITVTNLGNIMTDDDYDNVYNALAGADGVENSFAADWEGGDYIFTAPDGVELSIDGGKTWAATIEVSIEAAAYQAILVKSATLTDVQITVSKKAYEFTLIVGDNTVSMIPGKEYTVTLGGFTSAAMYKDFILSWTDANIVVTYGWMGEVVSGTQYGDYSDWSSLTIVYNGAAEAEIAFNLAEPAGSQPDAPIVPSGDALVVGDNAINVTDAWNGAEVFFTATEAGTYILSAADGETNAFVMIKLGEFSSEEAVLPYSFTLAEGASINFIIFTNDWNPDTVDLVLTKEETGEGPVAGDAEKALNGTYNVNFLMDGLYVLVFEDGVLTVTDNNSGAYTGTFYYVCGENSSITVTNTDGTDCGILLSYGLDGSLQFQCDGGLMMAQPLVKQEASDDDDVPGGNNNDGLILGDNAIVVESWGQVIVSFTATEAGTYVLGLADGETNAFIIYEPQPYMSEEIILPYSFTLEAGASITFIVMSADYSADTINLVLTKESSEGPEASAESALNGTYKVNWIMDGMYVLTFKDGTLTVADNNTHAYDGSYTYVCGADNSITVTNIDGTDSGILLSYGLDGSLQFQCSGMMMAQPLVKQEESSEEGGEIPGGDSSDGLVLGDNAIDVESWGQTIVSFTATEAGTYILSPADGELNACVWYEPQPYMGEEIALPYTFELAAGGSITFIVMTADYNADTINLVITKA